MTGIPRYTYSHSTKTILLDGSGEFIRYVDHGEVEDLAKAAIEYIRRHGVGNEAANLMAKARALQLCG